MPDLLPYWMELLVVSAVDGACGPFGDIPQDVGIRQAPTCGTPTPRSLGGSDERSGLAPAGAGKSAFYAEALVGDGQ